MEKNLSVTTRVIQQHQRSCRVCCTGLSLRLALNISSKPHLGRMLDSACQHRSCSIWVSYNNSSPFFWFSHNVQKPSPLFCCHAYISSNISPQPSWKYWLTYSQFLFQLFGTVATRENRGLTTVLMLNSSINEQNYPYSREYSGFHTTGKLFTSCYTG